MMRGVFFTATDKADTQTQELHRIGPVSLAFQPPGLRLTETMLVQYSIYGLVGLMGPNNKHNALHKELSNLSS